MQLPAAQGLLAAQGLHGLQGMAAPQGLQGLHPGMAAGLQGLQLTAPQGVVAVPFAPIALLAAVGLAVSELASAWAMLADRTAAAAVAITSFFMI